MTSGFSLRALGKGSIASLIKVVLDVLWVLLWIAAICLAIGIAGYALALVLVENGVLPRDLLAPGEGGVSVGPVTVRADNNERLDNLTVIAPAFLAGAVAIGGALLIVLRLKRLFKNFTSGEPFSRDNAGHLRVIWITMLVLELSRYAIAAAMATFITVFGQPEATQINVAAPSFNLMTWIAIFILIVLAEVFREGARLKEEQELTI